MNGLVQIMSKFVQHNVGMSHDDNLLLFSYVWHCIMYRGLEITALAPIALSNGRVDRKPGDKVKPTPTRQHLQTQFLRRTSMYMPEIMKSARNIAQLEAREKSTSFWTVDVASNMLSPMHICAQALEEEVNQELMDLNFSLKAWLWLKLKRFLISLRESSLSMRRNRRHGLRKCLIVSNFGSRI